MLLANALSVHFFGRQWRLDAERAVGGGSLISELENGGSGGSSGGGLSSSGGSGGGGSSSLAAAHARLVSWFGDYPSEVGPCTLPPPDP
jgi:hypothetical protein